MAGAVDLRAAIDELYALLPEKFTAARNAKVKAARAESDADVARQLGGARRPSTCAWVVNVLVRERAATVREVLEAGVALRAAQAHLDMVLLRELMGKQRALLAEAVTQGRECAAGHGRPVSESVSREVEQTLRAAMTDVGAAAAVRSGQLVAALTATGLEAVDVGAAVGAPSLVDWEVAGGSGLPEGTPAPGPERGPDAAPRPSAVDPAASPSPTTTSSARQGQQLAQRRLEKAERAAAAASEALVRAGKRLEDLRTRHGEVETELTRVRRALRELEREADDMERDLRAADRARDKARVGKEAAREAVEHALRAVERLGGAE